MKKGKKAVQFCGWKFLWKKKIGRVSFQILNLLLYTFTFSYFFVLIDQEVEIAVAQAETKNIPRTESADFQMNCCTETHTGSLCEDILSGSCQNECGGECIQTNCNNVAQCKLGYCLDTQEGTCPGNVPREKCESNGGRWTDASLGEPLICKKGCCVLGANTKFSSEIQCKKLSQAEGVKLDFRSGIVTEIECIALGNQEDTGACVQEIDLDKVCSMGSRQDCTSKGGKFLKNLLCTSERLQAGGICKKTDKTACSDDRIYFLDSCNNRANIYDFNRINDPDYWDILIPAEESCGFGESNMNSQGCGNCDYFLGSICGAAKNVRPNKGEYICRDIRCQYEGQEVQNGESWCVYDGDIGNGVDLVGSRHWRRLCANGDIRIEQCDDFRNYICVQDEIPLDESGSEKFTSSKCRVNRWQECLSYNSGSSPEEIEKKCNENTDCVLREVDVDKGFKFSLCAPNYPSGFDLSADDSAKSAEQICNIGSSKCTVIYEKTFGGWECKQNCDCENKEFTEKMNKLCTNLGDCGLKKNFVGDVDEAYVVKGAPKLSRSEAVGSLTLPSGKHAEFGKYFPTVNDTDYSYDSRDATNAANKAALSVVGLGGVLVAGAVMYHIVNGIPLTIQSVLTVPGSYAGITVLSNFAIAGAAGAAVAFIFTKLFGLEGEAALAMAIGGTSIGVATAAVFYALGSSCLAVPILCLGIIVIALLIMAIVLKVLGIGKIKKKVVEFQCKPWQAPTGGEKCAECNKDPLKSCSKYRCESLGQACQFLNEGTKKEVCVGVGVNDVAAPFISPDESVLHSGYKYSDISQNGFRFTKTDGSCLDPFNPVFLGITTHEPAQCRMDLEHKQSFEEMSDFFAGSNLYIYNHTLPIFLPSNEALKNQIIDGINLSALTDEEKDLINSLDERLRGITGNINFYIRCQDYNGNGKTGAEFVVKTCLTEGPDKTAPKIESANPQSGSFIGSNNTMQNISILVNEPAECRWSRVDQEYEKMEGSFECEIGLESATPFGFVCNALLRNLTVGENSFSFRCKDRPSADADRNANDQSYTYSLKRVKDKLMITKAQPNDDIVSGKLLHTVTLEVETAQGAEQGKARCDWNFNGGRFSPMSVTYSSVHKQILTDRPAGFYPIGIRCEDIANDIAGTKINFSIRIDASPPVVTRAFRFGEDLKILTSEPAECRYSFAGCNFKFDDATQFIDDGLEHTVSWKPDVTYHIVCRDKWGNLPSDCSIRVNGFRV